MLYNFEAAAFRGIGNTKTPLKVLTFSGVLNVLLNLFFVCVIKMNVEGVAYATVIANAVSAVTLFVWLLRSRSALRLRVPEFRIDFPILGRILRLGIPAGITGAVFSVANLTIQSAINSLGTVVMAASSAAFTIEIFAYIVLNSFSQAWCTEVGMYLAMSRQADREGYPEVAEAYKRIAFEEAEHAAKFAELLGAVVKPCTKTNLQMRVDAEQGACAGKLDIAKKAKALGYDAIHDLHGWRGRD